MYKQKRAVSLRSRDVCSILIHFDSSWYSLMYVLRIFTWFLRYFVHTFSLFVATDLPFLCWKKSHMSPLPMSLTQKSSVSSSTNLTKRGWRGGWGSTKQISPTPAAFRSSDFLAKMSYPTQIKGHIAQLQKCSWWATRPVLWLMIMNCCDSRKWKTKVRCGWEISDSFQALHNIF